MSNILPGQKYRHFKGNEYEVVCIARHTESEEDLVIYRSLKNPDAIYAQKAVEIQQAGQEAQEELARRVEEDKKIQAAQMQDEHKEDKKGADE